jgi:hypothetical protein
MGLHLPFFQALSLSGYSAAQFARNRAPIQSRPRQNLDDKSAASLIECVGKVRQQFGQQRLADLGPHGVEHRLHSPGHEILADRRLVVGVVDIDEGLERALAVAPGRPGRLASGNAVYPTGLVQSL